jgi:hypothetical protein
VESRETLWQKYRRLVGEAKKDAGAGGESAPTPTLPQGGRE